MGFFKKIFKGIKKVFKKIGKAVKSVFKKVGKFMGKIGIVGQLGLALIMPYALPALGGLATGMMGTQLGGALGAVVKGAGHFLNAAVKVGTRVGQAFKSVTSAVTKTIGNMVGATINSIPGGKAFGGFMKELTGGMIDITGKNFSNAWDATQKAWSQAGSDLGQLFSKSTIDSSMNKFGIQKSVSEGLQNTDFADVKTQTDILDENVVGPPKELANLPEGPQTLGGQSVAYDPVTGKTTLGAGPQGVGIASETFVDPITFDGGIAQGVDLNVADSLGLGTPGTTYSAGRLPLGTDEALFTVGGTEATYRPASLLMDPASTMEASVKNIAQQPRVVTEFDPFVKGDFQNVGSGGFQPPKSLAARAGETGRKFLKEQGVEMSLMGVAKVADEFMAAKQQEEFMQQTKDPFAFVDMSYLTPQPIQSSPGLSTSGLTPMAGFDYFNQIQDDILNSNYNNIYAQGYYGGASLQAGLAQAYEELAP